MNRTNSPLAELGRRLEARRKEAELSLEALASLAEVDPSVLARFERGHGGLSSVALTRVAEKLGVPAVSFLHASAPVDRAAKDPAVMLRASPASVLEDADYDALAEGLRRARVFTALGTLLGVPTLADKFTPSPPPTVRSYKDGYRRARDARSFLVAREDRALPSMSRTIENDFNILVMRHRFTDERVLGASCRSGSARLIAVNPSIRYPTVFRFVLAHELGHHLCDLGADGIVEDHNWGGGAGFWLENPPSEKRANAFAAMFLAPEAAVRRELGAPREEGYGLDDALELTNTGRQVFGLGVAAMAWHLYNLRYFRSDETVRALIGLPESEMSFDFDEVSTFDGLERRALEAFHRERITGARVREILGRDVESYGEC